MVNVKGATVSENVYGDVSVKILADSVNQSGNRLTTFEVEFPRAILAEVNTHRVLSKNFSSSRAIPNKSFVDISSFRPKQWLQNQSGMVAKGTEIDSIESAMAEWDSIITQCKNASKKLAELGLHKQWTNRMNDWHVMAKGVISATELDNMFWLRDHEDAQPEFKELAEKMKSAMASRKPVPLQVGEWHLPYVDCATINGTQKYFNERGREISLDEALKISASCCAQVSYRKNDTTQEKADDIFAKLVGGARPHMSPFEHIATPIDGDNFTHMDLQGNLWCKNFKGWAQYRYYMELDFE